MSLDIDKYTFGQGGNHPNWEPLYWEVKLSWTLKDSLFCLPFRVCMNDGVYVTLIEGEGVANMKL